MKLVCYLLIISPWDADLSRLPDQAAFDARKALIAISRDLDLAAPYEFHPEGVQGELIWARSRYRNAAGCPPLVEAERLPSGEAIWHSLQFANAHLAWLTKHDPELVAEQVGETDRLIRIWRLMDDARNFRNCWVNRRQALRDLRQEIGDDDYYAGRWPTCVPLERFREIR